MEKKSNKKFASRWGFLLAAVGSAVGMANVWGFPAKMGSNGGFAFLIAYLIFVALFSTVGLAAEYAIGRRSRTGTLGSYKKAWATQGNACGKIGGAVGWLPLIGSLCIALGYAAIVSYVLKALFDSLTGTMMNTDTALWFDNISSNDFSVVPFHAIVVVGTLLTLLLGAKSIEKSNKIMMPVFFVIFVILAVRVAFLPGATEGYKFMFTPVWSKLADPMVWVWAMGQAFFSLSVTGSGMIVYGAYLADEEPVVPLAIRTAIFDTIAALVAALVIIPACFAYKLDIGAGPALLFVTLPRILQDIPLGQVFAIILYTAMVFAGVSSLQNMFEAVGESLEYKFKKINNFICYDISSHFAQCLMALKSSHHINKIGGGTTTQKDVICRVLSFFRVILMYQITHHRNFITNSNNIRITVQKIKIFRYIVHRSRIRILNYQMKMWFF